MRVYSSQLFQRLTFNSCLSLLTANQFDCKIFKLKLMILKKKINNIYVDMINLF